MVRRKSVFDYKLREILPLLGCTVIVFNIIGYLGGFLLVDFSIRNARNQHGNNHRQNKLQPDHDEPRLHDNGDITSTPRQFYPEPSSSEGQPKTSTRNGTPRVVRRTTPGPSAGRYSGGTTLSKSVVQHSDPCVYSTGRSPDDGRWYNFSVPSYRFYAYSAILDDRNSTMTDPVIRIIGLGTKPEDDSEETNLRLFCVLHYTSPNPPKIVHVPINKTAQKIGYGWVLNNEWVREYVFTCPLHESRVPQAIAVVENAGDVVASCMPVERPARPERKEDFAVCVQVAFDTISAYRLTEWLELQWILGVRHVGVYSLSLGKEAIDALGLYVKEGYVDLRKTDYIEHGPQQYLLQGSPVINDCLYRNMHRFNYIIVIDFDEVIIPKGHTSLRELVDFLKLNYSTMATPPVNYVFYNNYFFLDRSPDTSESPYLTMLRYRKRAPISAFGYSVKSIVDSRACLAMHNHFCWTVTKEYADRGYPYVVDHSIAVNQHYKKCHLNETECADLMSRNVEDDIILRYAKELKARVAERILKIKGHNI